MVLIISNLWKELFFINLIYWLSIKYKLSSSLNGVLQFIREY